MSHESLLHLMDKLHESLLWDIVFFNWPIKGPMSPYTPLNIANIHNIDLIPAIPPQYFLNPVNIYEFLLPPLITANPHYPLIIATAPP